MIKPIPTDWEQTKLGKYVKILNGGAFSSADATTSGARWLKIANAGIGQIKWDNKSFLPIEFLGSYQKYCLQSGDIVLALTRPTLGNQLKIAEITEEDTGSLLNQRVGKLLCSDSLNKKLAYYFLSTSEAANRINQQLTGTDPPNLSSKVFNIIPFLLPPLKEQNRIVAVLETWDKAIDILSRKIKTKKNIKKGLMQQLLTEEKRLPSFNTPLECVPLGNISTISKGVQFNKENLGDRGEYPCINGGIDPSGYSEKYNRDANRITISEGGNSCGYINFIRQPFWCGGHCYTLENLSINNIYLYQLLKVSEKRIMNLRVGSGIPNIQKKELQKFKVKITQSSQEQKAIAKILTTADDEITALEKKKQLLEEQKKFLLNNLVTGKIRTPEDLLKT